MPLDEAETGCSMRNAICRASAAHPAMVRWTVVPPNKLAAAIPPCDLCLLKFMREGWGMLLTNERTCDHLLVTVWVEVVCVGAQEISWGSNFPPLLPLLFSDY